MKRYALIVVAGMVVAAVGTAAVTASKDAPQPRAALPRSVEYEQAKDYTKAIAALQEQLTAHPNDYTLNLRSGWLSYLNGQHAAAARYYQTAIAAAPKSIEAKLGYLLPLLADGQYERAEKTAAQIVKEDPGNYYGNLRLAFALRMQGQFPAADKIVQRMLVAYPTDLSFLLEGGLLDASQDRNTAAQEKFAIVLSLDPNNAVAQQQLAQP